MCRYRKDAQSRPRMRYLDWEIAWFNRVRSSRLATRCFGFITTATFDVTYRATMQDLTSGLYSHRCCSILSLTMKRTIFRGLRPSPLQCVYHVLLKRPAVTTSTNKNYLYTHRDPKIRHRMSGLGISILIMTERPDVSSDNPPKQTLERNRSLEVQGSRWSRFTSP
jgi:hypothetical protein